MAETGDDDLMLGVVRRDPVALLALYDRHGRVAFALAYRVLGDAQTAEEVVQDAFLLVWRHAASFDAALGEVRGWLLTIVHHRAIDARRRRGRREAVGLDAVEWQLATPDVWAEVVRGLDRDEVRAAVAALPAEQRRAIELAYFEGLTHREIAVRTGAPLGTAKGRLRLGLGRLRASLVAARAERGGERTEDSDGAGAAAPPATGLRGGGGGAAHGR